MGNSTDQLLNACTGGGMASSDAVWMARAGASAGEAIVRVAIDPTTGRFAKKQDTLYSGRFTNFAVSTDGTELVVDDGSTDTKTQAMTIADMFARKFASAPTMNASSTMTTLVSPDGNRILKRQFIPDGKGSTTTRLTVVPFASGQETSIETDGKVGNADWADSVSVAFTTLTDKGTHFTVVDLRNNQHRNDYQVPDSVVRGALPIGSGWAWLPPNSDRIIFAENGKQREVKKPGWFQLLAGFTISPDQKQLTYWGWNNGSNDSLGYEMMPLPGETAKRVFTTFAERGWGAFLYDGSFVARVWETSDAVTLTKIKPTGQTERIGSIPHVSANFSHSADYKRATLGWREAHNDGFMYTVVKQ